MAYPIVPIDIRLKARSEDRPGPMPTPCRIWLGGKSSKGYGAISTGSKCKGTHRQIGTHVAAWEGEHGPVPYGLMVCHHCDTPACINPAHLFLGSSADNANDASRKGRLDWTDRHASRTDPTRIPRGDRHGSRTHPESIPRGTKQGPAKLNDDKVREIRADHAKGESIASIARRMEVGESTIRRVVQRTHWTHVKE